MKRGDIHFPKFHRVGKNYLYSTGVWDQSRRGYNIFLIFSGCTPMHPGAPWPGRPAEGVRKKQTKPDVEGVGGLEVFGRPKLRKLVLVSICL